MQKKMNDIHDYIEVRYINGDYAKKNPDWDKSDSPWKVHKILNIMAANGLYPNSIVDIGCGAGEILNLLAKNFPNAQLAGYDISPQLNKFWDSIKSDRLTFTVGDYFDNHYTTPDIVLIIDLLEHLSDPFDFLMRLKEKSKLVIFHIPLDLSAQTIIREGILIESRRKVGHIHYYTKNIALEMLAEAGYKVIDARYTGAGLNLPNRSLNSLVASIFRRFLALINKDFSVRLLGGETLIVLARPDL